MCAHLGQIGGFFFLRRFSLAFMLHQVLDGSGANGLRRAQDRQHAFILSSLSELPPMATHTQCRWFFYNRGKKKQPQSGVLDNSTVLISIVISSEYARSVWDGNGGFTGATQYLWKFW